MRNDILERKEEIIQWISENESKHFICKQLGCKQETLNSYLVKMGLEYSGNQGLRGKKNCGTYVPAVEYSQKSYVSSHKLKMKMIRDGLKEWKCEVCSTTEWCGKPVPIELDHIDGNHHNNEFSNLRILCCNCHAQTDTNSGRNKKR